MRRQQHAGDAAQNFAVLRAQRILVEIEQKGVFAQVHHHAEGCSPRVDNVTEGFLHAVEFRFALLAEFIGFLASPLRLSPRLL